MQNNKIQTRPSPDCPVCKSRGSPLYLGLVDPVFNAPGAWDMRKCDNSHCGTLWLNPMPLPDEIHKAYLNYYTHKDVAPHKGLTSKALHLARNGYRSRRFAYQPEPVSMGAKFLGALISLVPAIGDYLDYPFKFFQGLPNKGRLLEVGCGNGDTLKLLSEWGWDVEGMDFDPQAVSNARGKGVPAYEGDLFSRNYSPVSFDAIFSNHVIEHVLDPAAMLVESYRILKPGGRCIVVTPNADSILHAHFRSDWRGLEPPRHLHLFTTDSLARLAQDAGFRELKVMSLTRGTAWMYWASKAIQKGQGAQWNYSLAKKLVGELLHLTAYTYHFAKPGRGEELVLVGKR